MQIQNYSNLNKKRPTRLSKIHFFLQIKKTNPTPEIKLYETSFIFVQKTIQLMKDKIVVVTGAANGIGKWIAKAYAKAEATVVLADKDQQQDGGQRPRVGARPVTAHVPVFQETHTKRTMAHSPCDDQKDRHTAIRSTGSRASARVPETGQPADRGPGGGGGIRQNTRAMVAPESDTSQSQQARATSE